MSRQYDTFANRRSIPLDVRIDACAAPFVLQPGDELEIAYEDDGSNPAIGLSTLYTDDGLHIRLLGIDAPDIRLTRKAPRPAKQNRSAFSAVPAMIAALFRRRL